MSKIKVGDGFRIKVYGGDWTEGVFFDGEKGIVEKDKFENTDIDMLSVKITRHKRNYLFHRKQCRLLVRVRKCDMCDGDGNHKRLIADCPKCNGKGKVRV